MNKELEFNYAKGIVETALNNMAKSKTQNYNNNDIKVNSKFENQKDLKIEITIPNFLYKVAILDKVAYFKEILEQVDDTVFQKALEFYLKQKSEGYSLKVLDDLIKNHPTETRTSNEIDIFMQCIVNAINDIATQHSVLFTKIMSKLDEWN